ncbi:MAG: EAL domain-containing protein, partial [Gammaproteobacteria bacterium]
AAAPVRIAVNLSVRQFRDRTLKQQVADSLAAAGLDPALLEIEITESVLIEDTAGAVAALREFKDAGVRVAIDDFGTGYSSLSYLKRFPIDTLKIDRAFVKDVDEDEESASIVEAVVVMAHGLKLTVVAEGVENSRQLDWLRKHGCDRAQGYLLCRPMPAEELEPMLSARRPIDLLRLQSPAGAAPSDVVVLAPRGARGTR